MNLSLRKYAICPSNLKQDVLENEDVKLDNMFIASLVADIIRGMIYLHDSAMRYHGNLCTSNCLIDSRWVVKLSDFGLYAFKNGAELEPEKHQNKGSNKYDSNDFDIFSAGK